MLNLIRTGLGRCIAGMNLLFAPKVVVRSPEAQAQVDQETTRLALYQFEFCPFCTKVRRSITRLGLKIQLREAKVSPYKEQLIQGGGALQVPCLQITEASSNVKWLYESDAIIQYLDQRFSQVK